MKISVDKDGCIGCGLCVSIAENVFELDADGKSQVVSGAPDAAGESAAREAADSCPVGAITVE